MVNKNRTADKNNKDSRRVYGKFALEFELEKIFKSIEEIRKT